MAKERLDKLLVKRDLCASQQQAQILIRAGEVMVNRQLIDKPGTEVNPEADIEVKKRSPYVSRGGHKLEKAWEYFSISVNDRICIDGGISTGGFTDCLLKNGAKLVYGIDVGYGQVDWKLRNDPRVILFERTNLRYLKSVELYGISSLERSASTPAGELASLGTATDLYADLAVVDVSFISLKKILPALWELLVAPREIVLLVKPQFEVSKDRVGRKGVVRSPQDQTDAIFQVCNAANELGWGYCGLTWSPLLGPAGNIEYLLWLGMDGEEIPDREAIAQIALAAKKELSDRH